jgi:hypothetical protein
MRALLGTLGGAFFGGVLAVALIGLFAIPVVTGDIHPMDRERDLEYLGYVSAWMGVCGLVLGALAGFASRFPESGVPFLRCCVLIAVPVAAMRFLTAPRHKTEDAGEFYFSYFACFAVAVLVAALLVWRGLKRERTLTNK